MYRYGVEKKDTYLVEAIGVVQEFGLLQMNDWSSALGDTAQQYLITAKSRFQCSKLAENGSEVKSSQA